MLTWPDDSTLWNKILIFPLDYISFTPQTDVHCTAIAMYFDELIIIIIQAKLTAKMAVLLGVFFTMLPITPQGVKVNFYTPWCKSFHHSVKILLFEFGFTFFYTLKCNCEVNYYTQMCSFTLAGEKSFTDMCKVPNWLQSSILQKRILNISMTHCELTSQSLTKVKVVSWC